MSVPVDEPHVNHNADHAQFTQATLVSLNEALYLSYMSMTATIRVPEATRDQLAELARQHGSSLSSYLTDLARQERRAAIMEAARHEAHEIATSPQAQAEFELWDEMATDDID